MKLRTSMWHVNVHHALQALIVCSFATIVGCRVAATCGATSMLPVRQALAEASNDHAAQGETKEKGSQVQEPSLSKGTHRYRAQS